MTAKIGLTFSKARPNVRLTEESIRECYELVLRELAHTPWGDIKLRQLQEKAQAALAWGDAQKKGGAQ